MQTQDSSLTALRGLHESERRRQRDAEQARAKAERQRLEKAETQAREERLAQELAERQAAAAHERVQSTRLGRELDTARTEIAHLRGELEKAYQAQVAAAAAPAPRGGRTLSWLGITAGLTMLVGAAALAAAMRPGDRPMAMADDATMAKACPRVEAPVPSAMELKPATSIEPAPKVAPKPRPASAKPPRVNRKAPVTTGCDPMKDPLCGIDGSVSDEAARPRGKKHR